jgi:alkylation response protein AidB-like acyl-CoA dehydrogenase
MGRLAQTSGLTELEQDLLATVRDFVTREIIPVATELEHRDEYPAQIVAGLKKLGLFGLTIPEQYDGLGASLLTYALAVEEIARGWMSVSGIINTHFIVAHLIAKHGTPEQRDYFLPRMAAGENPAVPGLTVPGKIDAADRRGHRGDPEDDRRPSAARGVPCRRLTGRGTGCFPLRKIMWPSATCWPATA